MSSTTTAEELIRELAAVGVREAVLSPGSRSGPLALAFAAADLVDPLDERHPGEDLPLVGRLVGAGAAQPCRSVGGDRKQADTGVLRLEHGGVQIGDGCAGRRDDGDGFARCLGQAEREEPGLTLVDPYVEANESLFVSGSKGQGEWP